MHQTKRLHIIPMMKKGKNAADFVLSFYGGMLHERLPLQVLLFLSFVFIHYLLILIDPFRCCIQRQGTSTSSGMRF